MIQLNIQTILFAILALALSAAIGYCIGLAINNSRNKTKGVLRLAYDPDNPNYPAMGLMVDSMEYLMSHDSVVLKIEKLNFPK